MDRMLQRKKIEQRLKKREIFAQIGTWKSFVAGAVNNKDVLIVKVKNTKELQDVLAVVDDVNGQLTNDQLDSIVKVRAVSGDWHPDNTLEEKIETELEQHGLDLDPAAYHQSFTANKSTQIRKDDVLVLLDANFESSIITKQQPLPPGEQPKRIIISPDRQSFTAPAGMSLADMTDELAKEGLMLPCPSMINYVRNGLAQNAGHGTGLTQPSFAGTQQEIQFCDDRGNLRTISPGRMTIEYYGTPDKHEILLENNEFETIRGAALGMFGICPQATYSCIEMNNVRERLTSYSSIQDFAQDFQDKLENSEYLTLFMCFPMEGAFLQLREWQFTEEKLDGAQQPAYQAGLHHMEQQLGIAAGIPAIKAGFNHPTLLKDALTSVRIDQIGLNPGVKTRVTTAADAFHYQQSYPKELVDCSLLFPVNLKEVGTKLVPILHAIQKLSEEFAAGQYSSTKTAEYPALAAYGRFFKGTNGGLSTSSTKDGQITVALEIVGIIGTPGLDLFRNKVIEIIKDAGFEYKFHHGKYVPDDVTFLDTFGEKPVNEFVNCLDFYRKHSARPDVQPAAAASSEPEKTSRKRAREEDPEIADQRYPFANDYFQDKLLKPCRQLRKVAKIPAEQQPRPVPVS